MATDTIELIYEKITFTTPFWQNILLKLGILSSEPGEN